MLKLWLVLTALNFAQAEIPQAAREYRFTSLNEALQVADEGQSSQLNLLSQATLLIDTDNGRCTGTYISNQGHILTARHCLQLCMIKSKAVITHYVNAGVGSINYFTLDPAQLGKATCTIKLNGEATDVVIDAMSPGFILKMEEESLLTIEPPLYNKLKDEGYTASGDFAIIHIAKAQATPACVSLAEKSPSVGEFIQSVNFPGKTFRPDGFNSDELQAFASGGEVIKGIEENACFRTSQASSYASDRIRSSFNEPTALLSTLDSTTGSSGAGVMNQTGELIAILTNVYSHAWLTGNLDTDGPNDLYCRGSSKALRIERIRELIQISRPDFLSQIKCN